VISNGIVTKHLLNTASQFKRIPLKLQSDVNKM